MGEIIEIFTPNNLQYHFFPVSSSALQFKVQLPHDAHIALTTGPKETDEMVEIFIGGWRNTRSVIRRNRTKPDKVEVTTPGILCDNEYRGFWIRWDGGIISAGCEGKSSFISWTDPQPVPISFIGVCSGWGGSGTWRIETSPVQIQPSHKFFKEGLAWRNMINGKLPPEAMIGGFDSQGPIYIARAQHYGALCPGKYVPSMGLTYVGWGHREYAKEDFEILCGHNGEWIKTKLNYIPSNAFVAGYSEVHELPLYIGRAMIEGNLISGNVHVLYKTCYLPYKGKEIEVSEYEILVVPQNEIVEHPNCLRLAR